MRFSITPVSLLVLLFFSSLGLSFAAQKHYIVYLGNHKSGARHLAEANVLKKPGHEVISHFLQRKPKEGSDVVYSYSKVFHGFSAVLHEDEADEIAKHPRVISLFESKTRKLMTTKSMEFLGLENSNGGVSDDSLWKKANSGENVIIANIDSGVWPESRSFNDEGMGAVPEKFKGMCDNTNDPTFHCNKKLIGARYFFKGILQSIVEKGRNATIEKSLLSPRDRVGHGTHTLATAGGSPVPDVGSPKYLYPKGTAKGAAPRARVVAYKACWPELREYKDLVGKLEDCNDADVLAAFEAAINDNVDLISASIGIPREYYFIDAVAIGSFHAISKGIPVIAAGGNDGPAYGTVTNAAPWMITVAASTIDRKGSTYLVLPNGDNTTSLLRGAGISELMPRKLYPFITGAAAKVATSTDDDAKICRPKSLDPTKVKGKIVLCVADNPKDTSFLQEAQRAGAAGIVIGSSGNDTSPTYMKFDFPAVWMSSPITNLLFNYLKTQSNPSAYIDSTVEAPLVATFSSHGPNQITPMVHKPDVTAPGFNILAASTEIDGKDAFTVLSGTSMSTPHVAGVVALLKAVYPHWSPSAIKSAIMTTASPLNKNNKPIGAQSGETSNPFGYGAGHIVPNQAVDPGLVYDMSENEYYDLLCSLKYNKTSMDKFTEHVYSCPKTPNFATFNYPTISIPNFPPKQSVTLSRRLKNVGKPGTYVVQVNPPTGITATVVPDKLQFTKTGEELSFEITLESPETRLPNFSFGDYVWTDGQHRVRSLITVMA